MYSVGSRVSAVVENIIHAGVFVRLADGTRGYVRRRNLTLSGDVDPFDLAWLKPGATLEAIVIRLPAVGALTELSVRKTLGDPWEEFAEQTSVGDAVRGIVKSLVNRGVFVEIQPGIKGFVPITELVPWQAVELPEEVLWTGDHVEAVITHLDVARKRVFLSIRRRLLELSQVNTLLDRLHEQIQAPANAQAAVHDLLTTGDDASSFSGSVLVVEDDPDVRGPLVEWLRLKGARVGGAATVSDALTYATENEIDLAIVDVDMPDTNGITFVHWLRNQGKSTSVAIMSAADTIRQKEELFHKLRVLALFIKPLDLDELDEFVQRLARGEQITLPRKVSQTLPGDIQRLRSLARTLQSAQSLPERMHEGLLQLVEETQAEMGIMFHLDRDRRKMEVLTSVGDLSLNREAIYLLVDSPVGDAILEGSVLWVNSVLGDRYPQVRNLLEFLPFESCIGIPLQVGERTEYAVFLFHRQANRFPRARIYVAQAMAHLFEAVLERHLFDKRVQAASGFFVSGQLAAGFGHEVFNKVSGLDLQLNNVLRKFDHLAQQPPQVDEQTAFMQVKQRLLELEAISRSLRRTVEDFQLLMRTDEEGDIDVNQVLRQAEIHLRPQAQRAQVNVVLTLAAALPAARGHAVRLQQVFLNLMVNAIQQSEHRPDGYRRLTVSTTLAASDHTQPHVQIRFADSGPGIHRQHLDRIFALGFTTRKGGSGLGLFIARSLIESMAGRLIVEESLVPIGTTFLAEIPAVLPAMPGSEGT
jgi:signal transduction histidine kinase/predicted RNA-binding protein with RPS1 domain